MTKFTCTHCKNKFEMKDRAYCSPSQGEVCPKCAKEMYKIWNKADKEEKAYKEALFEKKVRKVVDKILEEKGLTN